jgi:hypothetical protein
VIVKLSAALLYPVGQADAECQGATVGEVITDCCAGRPGLPQRSLGDEVRFTPLIAGG